MNSLASYIGNRLKEARRAKRVTQVEAADFLDLTHSAIGQWERGHTLPELTNLIAIAELYSASLDRLIWGTGNDIDARLRQLPEVLRGPLLERLKHEIADAERVAALLPRELAADAVDDNHRRVVRWSKAGHSKVGRRATD
jgi:transcriptional regulator with XRE-family HTH domain